MITNDSLDKKGLRVAFAVFVALVVDGVDLQVLALTLPSLMKEFGISSIMAGALGTYTLIGMGVGGTLTGWLADRYGRVRVSFWSILTFSVATGALGLTQNYWQFAAIRFISGFGIAALSTVGTMLAAEYVPTRLRTTVLATLQAGWSIGYIIAGVVSTYILPNFGWRPLYFCAALPGAYALWLFRNMSESPSWFASRQAIKLAGKEENEFAMIWADRKIRRMFILWSFACIALQFAFYGCNTWLPSYLVNDLGVNLKNMGWYVAATYAMAVLGKIATGYLSDMFGRKLMWVTCTSATAVILPAIMYFATPGNIAFLLLIFGFLYSAPYAIVFTYMGESFPTSVRSTAVSTSYNMGRIGATMSPLMIGFAASYYSITLGIGLLGISYVIMALVTGLFIPEKMYDPKAVESAEQKTTAKNNLEE